MGNFKEDITKIKAFVFDVDGVFTDGRITMMPDNQFLRTYHAKDGFATKYLIHKGYHVAIISGGQGDALLNRFKNLGVQDIFINCFEKLKHLKAFMDKYNLAPEEVLYMGDDIPDIEPMRHVGISVCPADAAHEVRSISRYVSGYRGGEGCVRDIIEQVLRSQNNWATEFDGTFVTSA
ncbi:MAG: HAD-IIIA family hydrolase [Rikenellaceae bacterium]|nr:HAD-IIIA family hydrolase [Rikenellaceae bacterium]